MRIWIPLSDFLWNNYITAIRKNYKLELWNWKGGFPGKCWVRLWRQIFKETSIVQRFYFFNFDLVVLFSHPPMVTWLKFSGGWGGVAVYPLHKRSYLCVQFLFHVCSFFASLLFLLEKYCLQWLISEAIGII